MDNSQTMVFTDDENILVKIIGALVALGAVALVFGIIFGIIWYVLEAIGFYKLSKNRDIEPAWLAWIPIGQNYLLGELIGNEVWGFGYAKWILVAGPLVSIIISSFSENLPDFLALILLLLMLVFYVYTMTALYKLYQMYSTKPVVMLVFSIIFPFLSSIFVFAIRNNQPNFNAAHN